MAVVTFSAGYIKIFSPDPDLGLLASAQSAIAKSVQAADAECRGGAGSPGGDVSGRIFLSPLVSGAGVVDCDRVGC